MSIIWDSVNRSLYIFQYGETVHKGVSELDLPRSLQHLHLPIQVFSLVVFHKETQTPSLRIPLQAIMHSCNMRTSADQSHVPDLFQCKVQIICLNLFTCHYLKNISFGDFPGVYFHTLLFRNTLNTFPKPPAPTHFRILKDGRSVLTI